jgi:hypothetical protein
MDGPEPAVGASVSDFAKELCRLALVNNQPVEATFNGTKIRARQCSLVADVVELWALRRGERGGF